MPAEQLPQKVPLGFAENKPAAHSLQLTFPVETAIFPGAQSVQSAAPVALFVEVPMRQALQLTAASTAAVRPASQAVHASEATALEYFPAGQFGQAEEPTAAWRPAAQGEQAPS